jgi:uncharacterized protein
LSIVVSDTSPIRALAHLGHLEVLHLLFREVLIPPAVLAELELPRSRFAPLAIRSLSFICVQAPTDRTTTDRLLGRLHPGEAEAIALAIEVHADAILVDEAAGRAAAREFGLLPIGVLGTLLRARQRGLVGPLAPMLDSLQHELGFFISDDLRSEILMRAEET